MDCLTSVEIRAEKAMVYACVHDIRDRIEYAERELEILREKLQGLEFSLRKLGVLYVP